MATSKTVDRRGSVRAAKRHCVGARVGLRTEPRALAFAIGTALLPLTFTQTAYADVTANTLPTGGQYVYGSGSIAQQGDNKLQITQTTDKGTVNWNGFSIGSNGWVNFTQPSSSSITLNRVLGNNPSEIFGRMTANGQVFLSNPNGILFAPGASVNVGALFATTLSVSDQDAMAGRYAKWTNPGNSGAVINQGNIITANGYTALAGPQVQNDGVIVAQAGSVTLAAGNQVSLDMIGDGLIKVSVDEAALNASAINSGSIQADGGNILLTARSANALLDTVVNNTGVIRANSLVERNGEIVLDGGTAGVVSNSGTLQAAGTEAGTKGGAVKVLGDKVALLGGTHIDVSGDMGGGTALIGGNFHGAGPEQNASETFVARDAGIKADAINAGNGGNVAVWSNVGTRFFGSISAKGGAQAGDGGFAEVSGKQNLGFDGVVNLCAPAGLTGTLLLDPDDLYIGADPANGSLTADASLPTFNASDGVNNYFVTAAAILSAGDVAFNLQAAHDAIFNAPVVAANTGVNAFSVAAGSAITMNAGSSLTTGGGNIAFTAGNGMSLLALDAAGGTISASTTAGNITLGGALTTTNTTASAIVVNAGSAASAGTAAGGDIIISGGSVTTGAGGTATLFTGSLAGSTGVPALVGSGSGNFRYDSDELASNFTAAIGSGTYAVYREQPTLTISADDKGPITYGSATPTYTTSVTGLQNGDTPVQALSTPATVADDGVVSTSLNLTAGSHTLTPSGAIDQLGYAISYSTGTLTVNQLALTATAIGASSSTYGAAIAPGTVTFGTVVAGDNVTATATVNAALSTGLHPKAGTWTQTVDTSSLSGPDAGNYTLATFTSAANYTISPLAVTGAAIAAGSSTYGSPVVPGTVTFGNVQSGDAVNSAASVNATLSTGLHENAGTWTQTASTTLTGADAANYTFAGFTSAANYTISPLALTAAIAAGNSTYGSAVAPGAASFTNVQSGDLVSPTGTVTVNATLSTGLHENAGTWTQTLSAGTTGADAGNYTFAGFTSAANYTISPLALTAAIAAGNSTYGSAVAPGAASFTNVQSGDLVSPTGTVTVNATLSTGLHENAGTWTQTLSAGTTGADAGNYTFAGFTSAANYTISPLALTGAAIAAGSSTYGSPVVPGTVTFGNVQSGDAVNSAASVNATLSTGLHENAGTWTQTASTTLTGADAANYTFAGFTSAANYTINPAALAISGITASNKVYDGNTSATINTGGAVYTGLMTGDAVTVNATGTFSDKDVGAGKTVTLVSGYTGADVANYSITDQTTTTANITQLGSVAWTGAGGNSLWSNAANWAGNAIPDKANVANVDLSGATVTFDATVPTLAGSVQISNLSNGSLAMNSSTLSIGSNLNLSGYSQTGGAVSIGGSFTVTNNFSQTAGTISSTGLVDITQASGALEALNIVGSNTVTLTANTSGGDIALGSGGTLSGATVTFNAGRNVALNSAVTGTTVNINFGQQVAGIFTPTSTISGTTTVIGGPSGDVFDFTSAPAITATLAGAGASDTLKLSGGKTWNLDNAVQNSGTSGTLTWSGIENLTDTSAGVFNMGTAGSVSGNLTASSGSINYGSYAGSVSFNLNGGASTGMAGWAGITSVTGSAATTDTITGTGTYTITGPNAGNNGTVFWTSFENLNGGGTSSLQATSATWNLTGLNSGTVSNLSGAFSGMANLNDLGTGTFNMGTSGGVTGSITSAANGTVNYASYASPVTFNIAGGASTGMSSWSGIASVTGSGGSDTIAGNGATYNVTLANGGSSPNGASGTLGWTSFENITDSSGGLINLSLASNNVSGTITSGGAGPASCSAVNPALCANLNSDVNVTSLNVSVGGMLLLTGNATSWNLTGPVLPAGFGASNPNANVFFNGACVGGPACGTVITIVGSIGATVSQAATQALQDATDTDSVQKQIDYGFAGDVGMTPPMDHRIDDTGISTPHCFEESRDSEACRN